MEARALLAELERRGVELRAAGDRLRFRPPSAVPLALLAKLKARKPELLALLEAETATVAESLGGASAEEVTAGAVLAMPLTEFAGAGLVVEVESEVLGERVIFASDDARLDPGERRVVYRAHELRALLPLQRPEDLRRVHAVKRTFRGTVTDLGPERDR